MSFAIAGLGGEQLRAQPQTFQAPSLGGRPGRPAAAAAAAAPAGSLTNAAQPAFAAILNIGAGAPGHTGPVSFTLTTLPAFVTSGLTALQQSIASSKPASAPVKPATPAPAVSPAPAPAAVLNSTPSLPPSKSPQYVLPSSPTLVARISSTVRQIAINAVYPAPIFSFQA